MRADPQVPEVSDEGRLGELVSVPSQSWPAAQKMIMLTQVRLMETTTATTASRTLRRVAKDWSVARGRTTPPRGWSGTVAANARRAGRRSGDSVAAHGVPIWMRRVPTCTEGRDATVQLVDQMSFGWAPSQSQKGAAPRPALRAHRLAPVGLPMPLVMVPTRSASASGSPRSASPSGRTPRHEHAEGQQVGAVETDDREEAHNARPAEPQGPEAEEP